MTGRVDFALQQILGGDPQPSGQHMYSVSFPESFVVLMNPQQRRCLYFPWGEGVYETSCSNLFILKCPRDLFSD